MPIPPVILNLLGGPVEVDAALIYCLEQDPFYAEVFRPVPDEVPRIIRMLDLIAHGAAGHGLVHLLLISAAETGFAWVGVEACPTFSERYFLRPGQLKVSAQLADRKGFRGAQFLDV